VKSYRDVLHQYLYLYHPERKFSGPDGLPCDAWRRGILQRRHIIAKDLKYCGKEVKRKLEEGPVDHDIDYKCKVYENGRVAAAGDSQAVGGILRTRDRERDRLA
jgi:hypothetical protein